MRQVIKVTESNNEGSLVFSYNLEDIDQTEGGADVFNGQDSVLWKNIRAAFFDELKAMYQNLRSTGVLSYSVIEEAFEAHQGEWGEAIFNEDAYFKYLAPLIEDGSGAYLAMLQGSKAEQRKWWLYNRFRYIDSKYNAGDSLSDVIQIRGYAKSDVTVTPYADVYATVKYGSYLVQTRAQRNNAYTLPCPLDNVNDTEIYIYSASQLADVGDLSGFKVGYADFSMGTKLQSIKLGDSSQSYSNGNMQELYLGNNILLRTLDVRNCPNLGRGDMKSVDISGCKNIENVYFDGTAITGVELPVGGILKKLHLPATVTNLTIRDQPSITEFSIPSYSSISTLWLDNVSSAVDEKAILRAIPASSRVRVMNFYWEVTGASEIGELFDILDTMRGLDEHGGNMDTAQLGGTIHTTSLTGDEIAAFNARYPYISVIADHVTSYLYYKTWDGSETLKTVTCIDGVPQDMTPPTGPARAATERFRYTFVGWNTTQDASADESGYLDDVIADRTVYAAYSRVALTYLTYKSYDGATAYKTVTCVSGTPEEGAPSNPSRSATAQYTYTFVGWSTSQDAQSATSGYNTNVTSDRIVYAAFSRTVNTYTVTWKDANGTTLETDTGVQYGATPTYNGATPSYNGQVFQRWTPAISSVTGNVTYTASYIPEYTVYFYSGSTLLQTSTVQQGGSATYNGAEPTKTGVDNPEDYAFTGWSPAPTNIQANTSCYAQFSFSGVVNTISDDLATLMSNCDAGNTSGYSIGDTKKFNMGTMGNMSIQLVAKNADPLASGSGNANTTWLMYYQLPTSHRMNPAKDGNTEGTGAIGGWDKSEMKQYVLDSVVPNLPADIRNKVKTVKKYSRIYNTAGSAENDVETSETFWLASRREMFGAISNAETKGPIYSDAFPDNASRIKSKVGASSASWWWLRSANGSNYFYTVSSDGSDISSYAHGEGGVVVGFCI